jgi:riboflavin kinase / FMN adenylyltransferase
MFRVFHSFAELDDEPRPCALTIGNFDGVHEGHRLIMREVVELGRSRQLIPSVLTFHPHPAKVVAPARAPRLLSTPEERFELMKQTGIEQVFVLPFDKQFSELSPHDFVKQILVCGLNAKAILVGANFRFGNRAAGHTDLLRELGERYGFLVGVIEGVTVRGREVSSTEVRRLVQQGAVSMACRLLGRPYAVEGMVVRGHGIGAKQTVPTLNLDTKAEILPANGVYITRTTDLDSGVEFPSITNIGVRPTFNGDALTVETFLLAPLYGRTLSEIRVAFLRRVRDEKKFDSAESLKAQIMKDVGRAQAYFRRILKITPPRREARSESL